MSRLQSGVFCVQGLAFPFLVLGLGSRGIPVQAVLRLNGVSSKP